MKSYMVTINVRVEAESEFDAYDAAKKVIMNDEIQLAPVIEELNDDDEYYLDDEDDGSIIDITAGMLKPEIKNKYNAILMDMNYDVLPICSIPRVDPGGNYDTFVIADVDGMELTLADLKPEILQSFKKADD